MYDFEWNSDLEDPDAAARVPKEAGTLVLTLHFCCGLDSFLGFIFPNGIISDIGRIIKEMPQAPATRVEPWLVLGRISVDNSKSRSKFRESIEKNICRCH